MCWQHFCIKNMSISNPFKGWRPLQRPTRNFQIFNFKYGRNMEVLIQQCGRAYVVAGQVLIHECEE